LVEYFPNGERLLGGPGDGDFDRDRTQMLRPKFNSGFGKITVPQYVTGSRDGLSTTSLQR
jgi:hypothetical protein